MNNPFTVHCIAWQAGALLLKDVRAAACKMGRANEAELATDSLDEKCRHAIAISTSGQAIGCARITQEGRIERMVVLPHEHCAQIEAALKESLNAYAHQVCSMKSRVADLKRAIRV